MTFDLFVKSIRDGSLRVETGAIEGGRLVTRLVSIDPTDVEGCTAEAFHQGALDPSKMTWGEAVAQMRQALNEGAA